MTPPRSRVTAGVPAGGQYATEARSEPSITLAAPAAGIPAQQQMIAALDRYGLDDIAPDHTGATFQERWTQVFAILDEPEPQHLSREIYSQLGDDFDIGRDRGGPDLVWFDPNGDYDADQDDTSQWIPVTSLDARPDGSGDAPVQLAVSFYTRNGGGNRECWCPSDECECSASVVDKLTDHPRHLHDQDDSFDRTYASFYFRLDETPQLRAAFEDTERAERHRVAQTTLRDIEAGTLPPWSVMCENPDTAAQIAAERLNAHVPPPELEAKHRKALGLDYRDTGLSLDVEHLHDLDEIVRYLSGDSAQTPDLRAQWGYAGARLTLAIDRERSTREHEATAADHQATFAALQDGTLPAAVVRSIEASPYTQSGWHRDIKYASELRERAMHSLADLTAARDGVRAIAEVKTACAQALGRAKSLTRALHWPGTPQTCPVEPEK